MRAVLAAVAMAGALSAATVSFMPEAFMPESRPAPRARRLGGPSRTPPRPLPDAAARLSLRRIAVIAAGQGRTLRRSVRRCAGTAARGRCALMALAGAAAGARLNGFILRQIVLRLPAGPCVAFAGRLGGLMAGLAYVADEGTRGIATAGLTWSAARAASRVGGRVIAFGRRTPPHRCAAGASPA